MRTYVVIPDDEKWFNRPPKRALKREPRDEEPRKRVKRERPGGDENDEKPPPAKRPRPLIPRQKWNRAPRDHPNVRAPRTKAFPTLFAFDQNQAKDTETLQKYRTAANYLYFDAPKAWAVMEGAGFRAPGTYHSNNQQLGLLFTLPSDVPSVKRFGHNQAGLVMRETLRAGCTECQAEAVSKLLSYVFQLQNRGGVRYGKYICKNFDTVRPHEYMEEADEVRPANSESQGCVHNRA